MKTKTVLKNAGILLIVTVMVLSTVVVAGTSSRDTFMGFDETSTAHSVTWTTIVCVPIVVLLIAIFGIYLI